MYQWSASNVQERLMFFAILWKLCSKYLPKQSPMFVNIPSGIIEDSVKPEASAALEHEGNIINISTINFQCNNLIYIYKKVSGQIDGGEEYQALTDREERDLERLLSQSNNALSNAEKFMEQLSKDLSLLDGVCLNKNIQNS